MSISLCLPVCLSVCLSVCLTLTLSLYFSVWVFILPINVWSRFGKVPLSYNTTDAILFVICFDFSELREAGQKQKRLITQSNSVTVDSHPLHIYSLTCQEIFFFFFLQYLWTKHLPLIVTCIDKEACQRQVWYCTCFKPNHTNIEMCWIINHDSYIFKLKINFRKTNCYLICKCILISQIRQKGFSLLTLQTIIGYGRKKS